MCFIDEKCYVSDPESDAIIKELQNMAKLRQDYNLDFKHLIHNKFYMGDLHVNSGALTNSNH
jgi:hypothetical protein